MAAISGGNEIGSSLSIPSCSLPYYRMLICAWLALTACVCGLSSARAETFDTTADAVLGQSDFAANEPNRPVGFPLADNLALSNAAHTAVAPNGRIYVSDPDNHRVLSWTSAAGFAIGEPADMVLGQPDFFSNNPNNGGVTAGSFFLPQGIWVDEGGNLWVADAFNSRVLKFENPPINDTFADLVIGQPDFTSNDQNLGNGDNGTTVALPDGLQFPGRVLVVGADVYIADSGNSRVLHYTNPTTNKPFADLVFGQFGDFTCRAKNNDGFCNNGCCASVDNLLNPIGIAVDAFENLYVADWANHRVLRFDAPLSSDTIPDAVFGQPDFVSRAFDNGGPTSGLQLPIDLQFDSSGSLYVADSQNHRVLVFCDPLFDQASPDGVFGQLGSFTTDTANHGLGPFATDADGLHGCTGLAVDSADNLFVLDTNNNRLLRFDEVLQPTAAADFDCDGDVDLTDYGRWAGCVTGPAGPTPAPVCQIPDLDKNRVVDLLDFALFQRCMSGDGAAVDVSCAN